MNAQEFREHVIGQLSSIDSFMKTQAAETTKLHTEHDAIQARVEDMEKQIYWYNRLGALVMVLLMGVLGWFKVGKH